MFNTRTAYDEKHLLSLLNSLEENKNVECVLKKLCRLAIPETIARRYRVLDKIKRFENIPMLEDSVKIVVKKNKHMAEMNRIRRIRNAVKEAKKAKVFIVLTDRVIRTKRRMLNGEYLEDLLNPVYDPPTLRQFPLKFGPGIKHSQRSPFGIIIAARQSPPIPNFLSDTSVSLPIKIPTPPSDASTSNTTDIRNIPYFRNLYQQIVRDSEELSQVNNPSIDQVLEEMSMISMPYFFPLFRK